MDYSKEQEKEYIKSYLTDYLDSITPKKGNKYICPVCKSGSKEHGTPAFSIVPDTDNKYFKCHSCDIKGDIFDLYKAVNNTDTKTAFKELKERYLPNYGNYSYSISIQTPTPTPPRKEKAPADYTEFFKQAHSDLYKSDYLTKRGISQELQERFNVGYVENWKHPNAKGEYYTPRIIIPTSANSYFARDTRADIPEKQKNFSKQNVGSIHFFNAAAIEKEYCFVVEGAIDALSIMECNFDCIGLGSANKIDDFIKFCTEKKPAGVIIFAMDNDNGGAKANEKIKNAMPAFAGAGVRCMMCNVSGSEKDVNDLLIKDKTALTENLKQAVKQAESVPVPVPVPAEVHADETPSQKKSNEYYYLYTENGGRTWRINLPLLAEYIRTQSHYIFVRNQATEGENGFLYSNGCYRLITDNEFKGYIKEFITRHPETRLTLKTKDVNEVFNNLITDRHFVAGDLLNADENIINFQNGLLYLDSMEFKKHDKQHTTNIYSTIQIPCNYNTQAQSTPVFDKFLDDFTGGDLEKRKFLLQYMAVCISNIKGYRFKTALFMVGPGNTGKSQLKKLTEMLIGSENCASVSISELEERFGTANLYNKRLVGDSDMSFMSVRELKIFKQVTGGDSISVEFKCRMPFNYTYNGLMWFCMNELPRFSGDRGAWVYDRIVIYNANNIIPENKRDTRLLDKMYSERESIIAKYLIPALQEVIKNGYKFDVPESSIRQRAEYQRDNSPVLSFFDECCTDRPHGKIYDNCTTKKVYDVFCEWCKENNNGYTVNKKDFNKEIMNLLKVNDLSQIRRKHVGEWYYIFTLTPETKKEYIKICGIDSPAGNKAADI